MAQAKVSSDALPALTGRRCVGTVMRRSDFSGKQGGTAEIDFLSLFPIGGTGIFYFQKEYAYAEETTGQTMVMLTQSLPLRGGGTAQAVTEGCCHPSVAFGDSSPQRGAIHHQHF